MILFLSQKENKVLEDFAKNFTSRTGINTIFSTIDNIYRSCNISVSCIDNKFSSSFNNINFKEIKLCYINSNITFYGNMFEFKNDKDKEYAFQEWNAALLCILESASKTKIINPYIKKYDCNTELEDILLFQKLDIDTIEMFLTNNSENFLSLYEIYNENLIIKNILSNDKEEKLFTKQDLTKLNKLYLSPYIFKKPQMGEFIDILILKDKIYAYDRKNNCPINLPIGLQEKLTKLKEELNISVLICYAILERDKYYFYSLNQAPQIEELIYLLKDNFENIFTEFLLKEYNC